MIKHYEISDWLIQARKLVKKRTNIAKSIETMRQQEQQLLTVAKQFEQTIRHENSELLLQLTQQRYELKHVRFGNPQRTLLQQAEWHANELEDAARTGDLMALSNAGFGLTAALDELWEQRNEGETDWADLLNLLQGALAKEEFERYSTQQCAAIKEIISKYLTADEVKLDDIENSIRLLREAGLDPWKGISGTLSE